jgi:hypothetical protein
MHIHAIGVPRIVSRAKSRWAWKPKLESVQEPEAQSDETGEDVGIVLEAEPLIPLLSVKASPGAL